MRTMVYKMVFGFALRHKKKKRRNDGALSRIQHNELDLDRKDLNEKPQLKTASIIESAMSETYTLAIFNKFQEELFQVLA